MTDLSLRIQQELERIDRLNQPSRSERMREETERLAGALASKKKEFILTHEPFLSEYLLNRCGMGCAAPQFDPVDLRAVWDYFDSLYSFRNPRSAEEKERFAVWLAEREGNLTDSGRTLLAQYIGRWQELRRQYVSAQGELYEISRKHQRRIENDVDNAISAEWAEYWQHHNTMEPALQKRLGYEVARRGFSRGQSGFHGLHSSGWQTPFAFCGWATCALECCYEGLAFRIDRDCFPDGPVTLYYMDDDHWPGQDGDMLKHIQRLSSGIANLRIEESSVTCKETKYIKHSALVFDLDSEAIKPTVILSGKSVPTDQLGGYVLVLPRAGEFFPELGEIRNGEMIPLHRDDFCMK